MRTSTTARIAAGLGGLLVAHNVALLLGILTDPLTQARLEQGLPVPGWRGPVLVLGAGLWLAIAGAFLARAGQGPLRRAPGWLVAALGWYGALSCALGALVDLPGLASAFPLGRAVLLAVVQALIAVFGGLTMWRTARRDQPTPTEPPMARPIR
ncbi:MAG: hypothetical protein MUF35_09595 [Candidatus Nanopelagicales bacterium]|jgi:hypothetical protein|nr:hypothetical protein [Candidatus Nanopelagicales bacterium]